jgi:hypothetical protein
MTTRLTQWLFTLGAAAALAGAVLLPLSVARDLAAHDHDDHALLEQLTPRDRQLVEAHQAHEAANPWHRVIIAGEAFLIAGLGALYLSERMRNQARVTEPGTAAWPARGRA